MEIEGNKNTLKKIKVPTFQLKLNIDYLIQADEKLIVIEGFKVENILEKMIFKDLKMIMEEIT